LGILSVDDDLVPIGFTDKNNIDLCVGDICRLVNKDGIEFIGFIEKDNDLLFRSENFPIYCFTSNYSAPINNQGRASMLEIIERNGKLL